MNAPIRVAALTVALASLVLPAVSFSAADVMSVQGTTNLSGMLAKAATAFESTHPGAAIAVKGTSSGAGIAAVKSGAIDVAGSDVAIDDPDLSDTILGKLGVVFIAGPGTGVKNINRKDVIAIYAGKIHNWKELGGKDLPIVVFGRPLGAGTRLVFEQKVAKTLTTVREPHDAGSMIPLITATPGGLGYVGAAFVGSHADSVLDYDGVAPTPRNIVDGTYTFATDEHLYVRKNADARTRAFVAYVAANKDLLQATGVY